MPEETANTEARVSAGKNESNYQRPKASNGPTRYDQQALVRVNSGYKIRSKDAPSSTPLCVWDL